MKISSMHVLLRKWMLVLVAVLAIAGCEKADSGNGSGAESGRLIADRPKVDLSRLAERSSPSYIGEDAMGSFRDIAKLREVGDKEAVPVLGKILAEHAGSTRIHGFAAAQALFCIGTPEAHRVLAERLLTSRYNAQLSINYTYHWEMAEPERSQFIKRYHLQNLSEDMAVKLRANFREDKDGKMIDFTVTLHNVLGVPLEIWDRQVYLGRMLYFEKRDGLFARGIETAEYEAPMPRTVRLLPGATHEYTIPVRVKDVAELEGWLPMLSEGAEIAAGTIDTMFDIEKAGRFKVYAMFEDQARRNRAKPGVTEPVSYWSGRAVSKPITVEISLK